MADVTTAVKTLIEPKLSAMGFQLFDLEFVKEGQDHYLRIYIDKPGGVTLDDCVAASEQLAAVLDAAEPDPVPGAYVLEVSSPGAERPLKDDAAIVQAIGEWVHLKLYRKVDGVKEIEGRLLAADDASVTLEIKDKTRRKEKTFVKKDIALIRLAIEF